jgi:phosphatidylserine/phosphatidylglycerophosphate/cardiolipin synthase-like enzyme
MPMLNRSALVRGGTALSGGPFDILKSGRNCWQIATASRAAVLVDGANYFTALDNALRKATRSIAILGWDFDAGIRLRAGDDQPTLGNLLRHLVQEREELKVRILIWDLSTLHAPSATAPMLFGAPWQDHPRIEVRLDARHPVFGAQHQKVVCIDDSVAFIGGIDLTVRRWDSSAHIPDDPRRVDTEGEPYEPVHDLQMAIEGEAAAAAARLVYDRWKMVTGEAVSERTDPRDVWPEEVKEDFVATPVALARTCPRGVVRRSVREAEALNLDALRSARDAIYIEAQYFADRRIGVLLAELLKRPDGPEVVLVIACSAHGRIERWIMNGNRDRVLRIMKRADRYGRLRVLYPVNATYEGDQEIFVHAKLVVVDDRFLRIGSSNMNRRSTGLDAELDVAIEAQDMATRQRIAAIRARLLGEHLCVSPEQVDAAIREHDGLISAIDALIGERRTLRHYTHVTRTGSTHLMLGTRILDPRGPITVAGLCSRKNLRSPGFGYFRRQMASASAKVMAPSPSGTR